MFLVDTAAGRIVPDEEIKTQLASEHPYDEWLYAGRFRLDSLPDRPSVLHNHDSVVRRQRVFGYTEEDLRVLLAPMAASGGEPLGSMGRPVKLVVDGKPVFICCKACERELRSDAKKYLAKIPSK